MNELVGTNPAAGIFEQPFDPQSFLNRVSYKDWRFELQRSGMNLFLVARRVMTDSDNPLGKTEIISSRMIQQDGAIPSELRRGFVHLIWEMIKEGELHEAAEWFKVDGVAPYHPHRMPPYTLSFD